ncbi:hypothetical protein OH492_28970 [Vibrio chagasii]|nr:hypothetical protein [Vibrio chagasii]
MVAISLTMKGIVHLPCRQLYWLYITTAYGVMIDAWPVVATNGFIACVNIYFLLKSQKEKKRKNDERSKSLI